MNILYVITFNVYTYNNMKKFTDYQKKIRCVCAPDRISLSHNTDLPQLAATPSSVRSTSLLGTPEPSVLLVRGSVLGVFLGVEGYTGGSNISLPVLSIAGSPLLRAMIGGGLGSTIAFIQIS